MFTMWRKTCRALLAGALAAFVAVAPARASIPRHTPATQFSLASASGNSPVLPDAVSETMRLPSIMAAGIRAPRVGDWLSRDPLGEAGGANLTAFCGNDPINHVDP